MGSTTGKSMNAGWLVSPAFDLLFFANLPVFLLLLPLSNTNPVEFIQIYFLTVPHRWLTLFLVAFDADRREGREKAIIGLPLLFAAVVVAVLASSRNLTCLLLIDYIWNGWHFASQHAGLLAVYSRRCGDTGRHRLERHGTRFLVCYVVLRTAGWSTGWMETLPIARLGLSITDGLTLGIAALLVLRCMLARPLPVAKCWYMASVAGVYSGLLAGLILDNKWLIGSFAAAGAFFHAAEYVALVGYYGWRKGLHEPGGMVPAVARQWVVLVILFCLIMGGVSSLVQSGQQMPMWWMALNVWAALLHYAYDGMIWRLRKPSTAAALGAGE